MSHDFDPIWDEWYESGRVNKYPWESVISFIFKYSPKDKKRKDIKILELGSGSGPNLWFAAREGFSVTGLEGSKAAVEYSRKRFLDENLEGNFLVGDFTKPLPFKDNEFDLIIDRGSLVCVGWSNHVKTVKEIQRVLKPGGSFHYNGYTDSNTSFYASDKIDDGLVNNITAGTLQGVGQLMFLSYSDVKRLFSDNWDIIDMSRKHIDHFGAEGVEHSHSEWLVTVKNKKPYSSGI